ncbi:hypothetical protein E4U17_006847 [Claviceps sp. LM77 group G4]|nr:hypothetical protein E4U17_006847 [Claviceps sp. LM77 group G4]KAG6060430.1 hypothetical protein E4U33_006938 [Claviceps sp. LM78 group G4]KAG6074106.1 hypothetical protein E4U16_004223 [Claviceps sp. LM84 group G4]
MRGLTSTTSTWEPVVRSFSLSLFCFFTPFAHLLLLILGATLSTGNSLIASSFLTHASGATAWAPRNTPPALGVKDNVSRIRISVSVGTRPCSCHQHDEPAPTPTPATSPSAYHQRIADSSSIHNQIIVSSSPTSWPPLGRPPHSLAQPPASSPASEDPMPPHNDVEAFHEVLRSSRRILALCGAGLSASSGLPTFRGPGGYWRNHDATKLATMRAFMTDPGLVWLFYGYRRHSCLRAQPNAGHRALAALAKTNSDFLCLTQNVDDLSQRANHPPGQLFPLHGSLFDIKCTTEDCDWVQRGNMDDPFCPALAAASEDPPEGKTLPLLDPYHRIKHVSEEDLPRCPKCKTGLQRPGVVWFGESLDSHIVDQINDWINVDNIDLMLVVGTSAQVYPAAGYIAKARLHGARIVTINPEAEDEAEMHKVRPGDFAFGADAATCLPKLLEPIIGKMKDDGDFKK